MARKYITIWKAIKVAKVGDFVPVRVHETAVATLIQAVKKIKTEEVADKKKLGMRAAGKLIIKQERDEKKAEHVIVKFALEWDGERL